MIQIYGIKNCDSMKKAFRWLEEKQLAYEFHDYKKGALTEQLAHQWLTELGWEVLINKRGTTWRKLDDDVKNAMNDELALHIILENTSIVKRPLILSNGEFILGFNETVYCEKFGS
ncbi:ArsC family reductase [Marinomonas epiphytica]